MITETLYPASYLGYVHYIVDSSKLLIFAVTFTLPFFQPGNLMSDCVVHAYSVARVVCDPMD